MTKALYREQSIKSAEDWARIAGLVKSNAKAMLDRGTPIRVIVTTEEQTRHRQQNAFLWAAVYKDIAEQVWTDGRQFSSEVWHEYFGRMFLPLEDVELPGGEVIQRRASTTRLGVKEFADYVNQVQAYAAQELGVRFSAYGE